MVIDPNNISSAAHSKGKAVGGERASASKQANPGTETQKPGVDSVSLSGEAQAIAKLESAVASIPDVDKSKTELIKAALRSGQYNIDSQAIAEKLLEQDDL